MNARRLAQFSPGTAEVTRYTVPADRYAIVKNVVVANSSGTAVAFSLSLVPQGTVASAANRVVPGSLIPGLGTVTFDLTQVLHAGDFISSSAGTAGVLAVTISGLEELVA